MWFNDKQLYHGSHDDRQQTIGTDVYFSSKAHVIADRIGNEMQRGATFIKGVGWYNKTESDILMVVVRKTESQQLIRIVKQEDEKAFVSVNTVMGVYGKGFDVMKK